MDRSRRVLRAVALGCTAALLAACTSSTALPQPEAAPAPGVQRYVALGDSFTAAPFVPETDEALGCYRSSGNYPALVAAEVDAEVVVDVSCSGADTTHVTRSQPTVTGERVPPQLDALTEDTDLVTVGLGGNDFSVFGTLVEECPGLQSQDAAGSPCRRAMRVGGGDRLLDPLDRVEQRLVGVVRDVRRRSPLARILLVGYPRIVPARGTCPALPLARGDYPYALRVNQRLDLAVRRAAERSGAELVDVWRASQGHDVCSDEPWVNGKDLDFSRALSYHPFPEGQQAVADLVVDTLD